MSQTITSLLWFVAILALIPAALWLLKRTPMGGAAAHGVLRSVAALPLSASQRIVAVEVGHGDSRKWLVIGVTPHSITTLHAMDPQTDLPGDSALDTAPTPFAQLLGRFKPQRGDLDER